MLKILLATALLATCAQADVLFNFSGTDTSNGTQSSTQGVTAAVAGFVDFYLVGCNASGAGCTLGIEINNLEASGTESLAQAITGLTFDLTNVSTHLSISGTTLTATGSGGGKITTVSNGGTVAQITGTPGSWKTEATPGGATGTGTGATGGTNYGTAGSVGLITLEANLSGGSSKDQIVDGNTHGFGTGRTSYEGPVYFQIANISGLTTSTTISDIAVLFGDESATGDTTLPEGFLTLPNTDCTRLGSGFCGTGSNPDIIGSVPEPTTPLLAGSALLVLAFFLRRRFRSAE